MRQLKAELERTNRLCNALSQINQAILRSCNQQELFDRVCQVAVELGGFRLAPKEGRSGKPVISPPSAQGNQCKKSRHALKYPPRSGRLPRCSFRLMHRLPFLKNRAPVCPRPESGRCGRLELRRGRTRPRASTRVPARKRRVAHHGCASSAPASRSSHIHFCFSRFFSLPVSSSPSTM